MNKQVQGKFRAFLVVLFCGIWLANPALANTHNKSHNISAASAKFLSYGALFQDRAISGTIKDEEGNVLPGASVLIKGTTIGTSTNSEGKFSLSVPTSTAILVISYIGYAPQEVPIEGQTTIEIMLEPDQATLAEIVVVGYGTQKRSDLTGAISSVKSEDLQQLPMQRVDQALQG